MTKEEESIFEEAYLRVFWGGNCDEPGGREFQRVRAEWIAAGRPGRIKDFIRSRANVGHFELH